MILYWKMCKMYVVLYWKMWGMDKLIQYINEYGKTNRCWPFEDCRVEPTSDYYYTSYLVLQWDDNWEWDWKDWHLPIPTLISKEYWFIKWLVENNKIDENKIFNDCWLYDSVLMKLAIQDEPIDFLISLLK